MLSKIRTEFKSHRVGFNGSNEALGNRDDLDKLAEIALRSGDPSLLNLFENIPTLEQLTARKSQAFLIRTEKPQLPLLPPPQDAETKAKEEAE